MAAFESTYNDRRSDVEAKNYLAWFLLLDQVTVLTSVATKGFFFTRSTYIHEASLLCTTSGSSVIVSPLGTDLSSSLTQCLDRCFCLWMSGVSSVYGKLGMTPRATIVWATRSEVWTRIHTRDPFQLSLRAHSSTARPTRTSQLPQSAASVSHIVKKTLVLSSDTEASYGDVSRRLQSSGLTAAPRLSPPLKTTSRRR